MKTITTTCLECGDEFEKRKADYIRSEKLKRPHFCCRSCSVSNRNKNWSSEERKNTVIKLNVTPTIDVTNILRSDILFLKVDHF